MQSLLLVFVSDDLLQVSLYCPDYVIPFPVLLRWFLVLSHKHKPSDTKLFVVYSQTSSPFRSTLDACLCHSVMTFFKFLSSPLLPFIFWRSHLQITGNLSYRKIPLKCLFCDSHNRLRSRGDGPYCVTGSFTIKLFRLEEIFKASRPTINSAPPRHH